MSNVEQRVLTVVSAVSRVSIERMMSKSRDVAPTRARQVAQTILVRDINRSCNVVAKMFQRDHSTVCNAVAVVRRDLETGGPRADLIKAARAMLAADGKADAYVEPAVPSLPLHHTLAPRQAKRVTKHGWVEADGALVVAP